MHLFSKKVDLPKTMKAVRLKKLIHPDGTFPRTAAELDEYLKVVEMPIPEPQAGEVLIKLAASPIQPADLWFMQGKYGKFDHPPVTPGIEGSGVIVKSGGGLLAKAMLGQKVACGSMQGRDGTWAEYVVTKADMCIPLVFGLNLLDGSMLMANPLSALRMVVIAKKKGAKAIANNAASSALGHYLNYFAKKKGLEIVNIVDTEKKKIELKKEGIDSIIITSKDDIESLTDVFLKKQVSVAFDTLGGEATGILFAALPSNGEVIIYGGLSEEDPKVDIKPIIFENKKISGFWVTEWAVNESKLKMAVYTYLVQKAMQDLKPKIQEKIPYENATSAIEKYLECMSKGKFIYS
jgi:NADPH2:quinone reductase